MRPGTVESQLESGAIPKSSANVTVSIPVIPKVAMNANASMTPPNCDSTEHKDVTTLRSSGCDTESVAREFAAKAPTAAPIVAEMAETTRDVSKARSVFASMSTLKLESVAVLSADWKALIAIMSVGRARKTAR